MGKIVAMGGSDFADPQSNSIMTEVFRLVGKKEQPKMVYLPTAGHDTTDDKESVEEYFADKHGYETTYLCLTDTGLSDEYIKSKLLSADLIYVRGGNLKFLMDTWNKRGIVKYIREAYENGTVLAGNSSGAMCWFESGFDDCGIDGGFMFIKSVGLLPYCMCPHFDSDFWHVFTEHVKMQELDGIAVDNESAIVYCDGKFSVLRGGTEEIRSSYIMRADENYTLCDLADLGAEFIL